MNYWALIGFCLVIPEISFSMPMCQDIGGSWYECHNDYHCKCTGGFGGGQPNWNGSGSQGSCYVAGAYGCIPGSCVLCACDYSSCGCGYEGSGCGNPGFNCCAGLTCTSGTCTAPSCLPDSPSSFCSGPDQCCSGNCLENHCGCAANGSSCAGPSGCCSGYCNSNVCGDAQPSDTTTTTTTTTTSAATTTTTTTTAAGGGGGTTTTTTTTTTIPIACPGGLSDLCGHLSAQETGGFLSDVPIELRDANGIMAMTARTDAQGKYAFANPGPGPWYVAPVADRKQSVSPSYKGPIAPNTSTNFSIKNVPGKITLHDDPGTFVLVTPQALATVAPPTIDQTSGAPTVAYSGAVDLNNQVTLAVPSGSYFLTCWKLCRNSTVYKRAPATGSLALGAIAPQETINVPNPACGVMVCP